MLLDVNGKVARLTWIVNDVNDNVNCELTPIRLNFGMASITLVLNVLKLWVDHVSSHRGDRLTPRACSLK